MDLTVRMLHDISSILIERGQGDLPVGYTDPATLAWVQLKARPEVPLVGDPREDITVVDLALGLWFVGEIIDAS